MNRLRMVIGPDRIASHFDLFWYPMLEQKNESEKLYYILSYRVV